MIESKSQRKLVRPLTPRELAELRGRNVLRESDRRRLAGIEQLRQALNDRFEESTHAQV